MKILFYLNTVWVGGIRTVTEILSKELRKRGYKIYWLLNYRCYNDERDFPQDQNIFYLPTRELLTQSNIDYYNDLINKLKIDLIINQAALFEPVKLTDSILNKEIPRIAVLHNNPFLNSDFLFNEISRLRDDSLKEKFKRLGRILLYPKIKKNLITSRINHLKLIHNGGSYIVTLSSRFNDQIKKYFPLITNISAITNPLIYEKVKNRQKEKIVLYVGRLQNNSKRIDRLISIWKNLAKKNPDWKLFIIGDGADYQMLKKIANNHPTIEFKGSCDPTPFYEKASIVCLTSNYEGYGLVLTEGMQHGCVPIAFGSYPTLYDIIEPGINGEIIKAFSLNEYKTSLNKLMNNEDYRKKLSANAKTSVKKFNRKLIVDQWENLFYKLIKEKNNND